MTVLIDTNVVLDVLCNRTDFVEESKKRNMEIWESEGSEFSAVFVLVNDEAKKYYLENDYPGAEYHCENVCYEGEFAVAYYDGCKKADKICENVTQIPDDWEEIRFQEEFGTNVDDLVMADARSVIYVKDSVLNNTRTVYSAFVQQDSGLLLDQGARSNVVSAILSVEKEVKSLSEARRLKNTERKEVKQGKRRDALMHNGFYTKKWSPVDVGGKVDMRVYDFISQTDISGSI